MRSPRLEPLEDRRMLSVLFVDDDASAGGDGLSWETAYADVQSAFDQAAAFSTDTDTTNDVEAIWVAEGTYFPSAELEPGDPRSASFSLPDGVGLYGGFAGTEGTLGQRAADPTEHETILSGDIGVAGDDADNAYTVVYCGEGVTAEMDGVTVTGGRADGEWTSQNPERAFGGGIHNSGTLILTGSVLRMNVATASGGGIYSPGDLIVEYSTISNNVAGGGGGGIRCAGTLTLSGTIISANVATGTRGHGGGILCYAPTTIADSTIVGNSTMGSDANGGGIVCTAALTIANTTISANSANGYYGEGGGIVSRDTLTLTNSTILQNSAAHSGGGIYSSGIVTVTNSTLSGNSARFAGGAIYSADAGTLTVEYSALLQNVVEYGSGGAIANEEGAVRIANSTIAENSATTDSQARQAMGGGVYNHSGAVVVTNSTVSRNSADDLGGGIFSHAGPVAITNVTLARNVAGSCGGGIYCDATSSEMILANTIVAENSAPSESDFCQGYATVSGSHNLIGDGSGQTALVDEENGNQVGTASARISAGFSEWTQFETGMWGYYLLSGSPALDGGENAAAVDPDGLPLTEDLSGAPRIVGDSVDIGALEGAPAAISGQAYEVTSLERSVADGGILTFFEAFEAANANRAIGDAPAGSFTETDTIYFAEGLSGTILVDDGELAILGSLTIKGPGKDYLAFDAVGANRVFLIRPDTSTALSGMTITGGSADCGGGIYVSSSSTLALMDVVLTRNTATISGGAIFSESQMMTLANCMLAENSAASSDSSVDVYGGAIYDDSGTLALVLKEANAARFLG